MIFSLVQIISRLVPHMYTIYWPPCWRTKEVLQHGGSILGSLILCRTFRRISQLWDNAHTLNLEICLLHLSSTISQVLTLSHAWFLILFSIAWQCTHSILCDGVSRFLRLFPYISHRLESYSVSSRDFRCLFILFPSILTVFNQFPMSRLCSFSTTWGFNAT